MRLLFCLILFAASSPALAQRVIDVNKNDVNVTTSNFFMVVGGQPFVLAKFAKLVDGSPYFTDQWLRGNVVMNGGKEYWGLLLKLDLLDNELHYQDKQGVEMIATSEIQKVVLFDTTIQEVFTFINSAFISVPNSNLLKGWYQLLSEGNKASVFKYYTKKMLETQPYNSATIEQSIVTSPKYFVLYNSGFVTVKKTRDLADIFSDKKKEILQYIGKNNLSANDDGSFISIINYYNSLKP